MNKLKLFVAVVFTALFVLDVGASANGLKVEVNETELNERGYTLASIEGIEAGKRGKGTKYPVVEFMFNNDMLGQVAGTPIVYVRRRPDQPVSVDVATKVSVNGKTRILEPVSVTVEELPDKKLINQVMSFHVIADPHFSNDYDPRSGTRFLAALDFIAKIDPDSRALIVPGDLTDAVPDKDIFYNLFKDYKIPANFVIALGNHDYQYLDRTDGDLPQRFPESFMQMQERYIALNRRYIPDQTEVYFDKWIDGYHFIALNPEEKPKEIKEETVITEKQFKWLEEKLAENAAPDKPIFVTVHQSLKNTFPRSDEWSVGKSDVRLKEIFRKYPQVVLMTGHIHNGFGVAPILDRPYGLMVDVPSFSYNENGMRDGEVGYHVEIYPDYMAFRAVDFKRREWLPQFDVYISPSHIRSRGKAYEDLLAVYRICNDENACCASVKQKGLKPLLEKAVSLLFSEQNVTASNYAELTESILKNMFQ